MPAWGCRAAGFYAKSAFQVHICNDFGPVPLFADNVSNHCVCFATDVTPSPDLRGDYVSGDLQDAIREDSEGPQVASVL
jgi:hypothetical protein